MGRPASRGCRSRAGTTAGRPRRGLDAAERGDRDALSWPALNTTRRTPGRPRGGATDQIRPTAGRALPASEPLERCCFRSEAALPTAERNREPRPARSTAPLGRSERGTRRRESTAPTCTGVRETRATPGGARSNGCFPSSTASHAVRRSGSECRIVSHREPGRRAEKEGQDADQAEDARDELGGGWTTALKRGPNRPAGQEAEEKDSDHPNDDEEDHLMPLQPPVPPLADVVVEPGTPRAATRVSSPPHVTRDIDARSSGPPLRRAARR